jgi:hypothetical protein
MRDRRLTGADTGQLTDIRMVTYVPADAESRQRLERLHAIARKREKTAAVSRG